MLMSESLWKKQAERWNGSCQWCNILRWALILLIQLNKDPNSNKIKIKIKIDFIGCKVGSIEATIERDREVSPEVWISRAFEADNGLNDNSEFTIENEDETDQAKVCSIFCYFTLL